MLPRVRALFFAVIGVAAVSATTMATSVLAQATAPTSSATGAGDDVRGANGGRAPRTFRITNRTEQPKYLDQNLLLDCQMDTPTRLRCDFYRSSCRRACTPSNRGEDCCVMCERDLPSTLELAPDHSVTKAWPGTIFVTDANHCAKCDCQIEKASPSGKYQVVVRAYEAYRCELPPCTKRPDGTVDNATPTGAFTEHVATFAVPSPAAEVVIEITDR